MVKILRIGDFHSKISNLDACQKLIDFIIKIAKEESVEYIEFLGDQMNNHSVTRVEVTDFWYSNLKKMCRDFKVICLVGNHDMANSGDDSNTLHSLKPFELIDNLIIVDKPLNIAYPNGYVSYMPYRKDRDSFVKEVTKLYNAGSELLICHQTITGAKYDNGFFAEDGIDPQLIPHKNIISGHIHTISKVDKCLYIGTPKWDTLNDANQEKGVWIFEHGDNMEIIAKDFRPTKEVVSPIIKVIINEGDDSPILNENAINYIELRGKTSWINKVKKQFQGRASIKAVPLDRKINISVNNEKYSIKDFLEYHFQPNHGITKEELLLYLGETNERNI